MLEMSNPIIVEFPLRGEWLSPNTPGTKIPSHGTNRLGTRYAYDFIQVDWNRTGNPAYRVGLMKYLLFGVQLSDYYCWGQEIYAPCDGIVIVAEDGYIENPKTNLLGDMANAYKNAHYFDPNKDDEMEYFYNKHRVLMDLCDDIALYNGYEPKELPSPWTILRQMYSIKHDSKPIEEIDIYSLPLFCSLKNSK